MGKPKIPYSTRKFLRTTTGLLHNLHGTLTWKKMAVLDRVLWVLWRPPLTSTTTRDRSIGSPLRIRIFRTVTVGDTFCEPDIDHSTANRTDGPFDDSGNDRFVEAKFQDAFAIGASLVNCEGGPDSEIRKILWDVTALRGKQYDLQGGGVGTRFVNLLAEEIERCAAQRQSSERELVLTALVLQRDKMVRKAKDIRPLLTRRMDMWEAGQLKELLQEAQRCDRQLATSLTPMSRWSPLSLV